MDPEQWRWVWLVGAIGLGLGEMASPGSFFLLPFAIGAGVAAALAFADVAVSIEWLAFLTISVAVFAAMRPLARRLDAQGETEGIGSRRLIGRSGAVITPIPGGLHELGEVRVDREEWRAETRDGSPLPAGTPIRVVDVRGTRVVVEPSGDRDTAVSGP